MEKQNFPPWNIEVCSLIEYIWVYRPNTFELNWIDSLSVFSISFQTGEDDHVAQDVLMNSSNNLSI